MEVAALPHDRISRHRHGRASITLVTAGSAIEDTGHETRVLDRGVAVVHPAGIEHALRFAAGGCSFLRIDMALSPARSMTLRLDDTLIARLTRELSASDAARNVALRAAVLRVVAAAASGAPSQVPEFLASARTFIDAHYGNAIALRDVARFVSIDAARLSREFRRAYGSTVGEAIRAARVRRAASMLGDSAYELRDIAAACGFFDASHLTRSFERAHGVKPARFRELHGLVR